MQSLTSTRPCGGLQTHFLCLAQPRLICKHRHHTTRVQIVVGPNELRVAHIFPHIIRIFTLFRRRCTPAEYQHEHQNHCNVDELFHRFLLMILRLRDVIKRPDPFLWFTRMLQNTSPAKGGMGGDLHRVVYGRLKAHHSAFHVYFFSGRPAMPVFRLGLIPTSQITPMTVTPSLSGWSL